MVFSRNKKRLSICGKRFFVVLELFLAKQEVLGVKHSVWEANFMVLLIFFASDAIFCPIISSILPMVSK